MPKIWITCTRRITYSQQISVSEEELEQLREVEHGNARQSGDDAERAVYELLEDRINPAEVFSEADEYEDISLESK